MAARKIDAETAERIRKGALKFSESLIIMANEPSVGMYHIQDHVKRSAPRLISARKELRLKNQQVEEVAYDTDYSLRTIKSLQDLATFQHILQHMKRSTELLQTLERGPAPVPTPNAIPALPVEAAVQTPNNVLTLTRSDGGPIEGVPSQENVPGAASPTSEEAQQHAPKGKKKKRTGDLEFKSF